MCKADAPSTSNITKTKAQPTRLLLSLESFSSKHGDPPSFASCLITAAFILAFLTGTEMTFRQFFLHFQDAHPLLEIETNRHILARHIGVDTLSCLIVFATGWWSRHVCRGVIEAAFFGRGSEAMPDAGHEERLYAYHPGGFRVALFFFCYQLKNLYDTIVWQDGPEFIFHHIFSLFTAWGSMVPGCGHYYTLFFFGMCEISTGVLCLLSNFDDDHGVPGLGDAMPMTKVVLGGIFVVLFIVCRCLLWPVFSRYFVNDCFLALKGDDHRTKSRRGWLRFFLVSLTGLSILQIAWLGEIFSQGKQELAKAGLL
jgi:hypothetical protein